MEDQVAAKNEQNEIDVLDQLTIMDALYEAKQKWRELAEYHTKNGNHNIANVRARMADDAERLREMFINHDRVVMS